MLRPPRVAEGRLFEYNLRRADCLAGVFPPLPTNATTSLGAAAGGNIWYIHPHGRIWSHMGAGRSPWFPTARSFFGKGYADWIAILKQVARALAEEVEAARAA